MLQNPRRDIRNLSEFFTEYELELFKASGKKLVEKIGIEIIREVIFEVLSGKNLRDSTEVLTRRRIASINLAILKMYIIGSSENSNFIDELPNTATEILKRKRIRPEERKICQWILGLTDKASQNVLRDDLNSIDDYCVKYIEICKEVIDYYEAIYGELKGTIELESKDLESTIKSNLDWKFFNYLLNTIGAETLTIRGSEKSAYGKLFGSLVLGSLLSILGFKLVSEDNPSNFSEKIENVFWLSSTSKRESDATLLYRAGKGIRFDIGFIGRGNPEISLDKVSRFEKYISVGKSDWYLATIIFVDTIGKNSNIQQLAEEIDGMIIQMSMGYWPQAVARILMERLGYEHELATMDISKIGDYLWEKLQDVDLHGMLLESNL